MLAKPTRCVIVLTAWASALFLGMAVSAAAAADKPAAPEYAQVSGLLNKYCVACHNADDPQGKLALDSYAHLLKGGVHGPAVLAGESAASRLVRVLTGQAKPQMPPEGSDGPSEQEIALLAAWIDAGAKGPQGMEPPPVLLTPKVPAASSAEPITALAYSDDGRLLAVGRFKTVELRDGKSQKLLHTLSGADGKITRLAFMPGGKQLVAASGISGLYGQACIWNTADGKLASQIKGHRDILYAAVPSPDGKLLATAGYDRRIHLWNTSDGSQVRTFEGHNGAVFDLAFSPDGHVLASASADQTVKLWQVASGQRLDTLSQPLKEQFATVFSPGGETVVAAGADNRIRVWRFVSRERPRINPLLIARFAHEGPITHLAWAQQGKTLVTVSEDRSIKLWETAGYTQTHVFEQQPDVVAAIAASPRGDVLAVGRMDGSLEFLRLPSLTPEPSGDQPQRTTAPAIAAAKASDTPAAPAETAEQEPNDSPQNAQAVAAPVTVRGLIGPAVAANVPPDVDLYRFAAKAGQQWVIEVNAARSGSPLDSKVEVLTADGEPIVRVKLQAVRDSYFTFRGKDSDISDDFRVHNWEEMELNEFLYADGEVVKLWMYPRGPDSGFKVYPGSGKRYAYFDTTPTSHALQAPCYIVRPLAADAEVVPNGLPVFPLYYENDDDSRRRSGSDSRLTFTAPHDGEYLVRISDVRGFASPDHKYQLTIRPRRPDFKVTLAETKLTVPAGGGREFTIRAERLDDFDGEIRVDVRNLPPGWQATTPVVIEAGQIDAVGLITAAADAAAPTTEAVAGIELAASATIAGQEVTRQVAGFAEIKLGPPPKIRVTLLPSRDAAAGSAAVDDQGRLTELVIAPGQTITANVQVDRGEFDQRISFGGTESGRNFPHGVFVDNIGLNGLLIPEGQTERTFFITAAPTAEPTQRLFHLKAQIDGGLVSQAVWLRVQAADRAAAADHATPR